MGWLDGNACGILVKKLERNYNLEGSAQDEKCNIKVVFESLRILGRRPDSFEAGYSPKVCFCDHCNEFAGSINVREFLYSLRDLPILKWDYAPQYISTGKKYSIAMSLDCLKVNISYCSIEVTWSPFPSSSPNHDSSFCSQRLRSPFKQQQ